MCKFCTHDIRVYFPFSDRMTDMATYNSSVFPEQLRHLCL